MATIQSVTDSFSRASLTPVSSPSNEEGFIELTRRLPADELALLHEGLSRVKDHQVDLLVTAMQGMNWQAAVFLEENYPHIALKAFERGRITEEQFTTIMFYWVNFTKVRKRARIVPLFTETGCVNPKARELIRSTLTLREIKRPLLATFIAQPDLTKPVLTEQQLDDLFEKMRKHPASAQCIFIKEREKTPELISKIQELGFNVLYETSEGPMVPSAELVNTYLQVKYGETNALKIKAALGFSSTEEIGDSIAEGKRHLALPFPGTTLPSKIDDFDARDYAISWHDIYHLLLISALSKKFQELFLKIGRFSKDYFEKHGLIFAAKFYELMIDMEFPIAQEDLLKLAFEKVDPDKKMNYIFWTAIIGNFQRAKRSQLGPYDKLFNPFIEVLNSPEERKFIEALLSFIPLDKEYNEGRRKELDELDENLNKSIAAFDIQFKDVPEDCVSNQDPRPFFQAVKEAHFYRFLYDTWNQRVTSDAKHLTERT